jgi:hypothetical protein
MNSIIIMGENFLFRATLYVKDRILAFSCGVALGMSGNFAYDVTTDYFKSEELKQAAGLELFSRVMSAHQSATMSIDPRDGFRVFSAAYKNTSSETDDERFEGKRIDNLIHIIHTRTRDNNIKLLLEKLKYANLEFPFYFGEKDKNYTEDEESKDRNLLRIQSTKILDYACCLANIFNADNLICTPPEKYFVSAHYCFYSDGNVIVAPGRDRLMKVVPFSGNEKPQLYQK